jgi:hypothetical protein
MLLFSGLLGIDHAGTDQADAMASKSRNAAMRFISVSEGKMLP